MHVCSFHRKEELQTLRFPFNKAGSDANISIFSLGAHLCNH